MAWKSSGIKKLPLTLPKVSTHAKFVHGSVPPGLRSPRIKPAAAQTRQYGKDATGPASPGNPGFGTTGLEDV